MLFCASGFSIGGGGGSVEALLAFAGRPLALFWGAASPSLSAPVPSTLPSPFCLFVCVLVFNLKLLVWDKVETIAWKTFHDRQQSNHAEVYECLIVMLPVRSVCWTISLLVLRLALVFAGGASAPSAAFFRGGIATQKKTGCPGGW